MGKGVVVAIVAAALSILVAIPANAASAGNIRPTALPACSTGAPEDSGGWSKRLHFGGGTDREDWNFQVRPRALVLGEPCVSGGNFAVPHLVQDLPSEGAYGEVGGVVTNVPDNDGTNSGYFTGYGFLTATPATARLCFYFAGDNSPAQEITLRVGSSGPGSGPTTGGGTVATMKSTWTGGTVTCPAGSNAVSSYPCGTGLCLAGAAPWEWRYGTTSTANSAWSGNMEHLPPLSFWGSEIGARMTLGNHGPATNDAQIFCATSANGATTTTHNVSGYDAFQDDYVPTFEVGDVDHETPAWERTGQANTGISSAGCAYLVGLTMTVCSYDDEHAEVCELITWTATAFNADTPYTEDPPVVGICLLYPANPNCHDIVEPPLVCEIDYSDPDNPITVLGEFFGGLGPWVGCMVVPIGWDRGGLLATAMANGQVAEMTDAYNTAIPDGIACGEVAEIPMLGTTDVVLDTCDMDVAPEWVKLVVSGVMILGIGALAIRRVMWAVGSDT